MPGRSATSRSTLAGTPAVAATPAARRSRSARTRCAPPVAAAVGCPPDQIHRLVDYLQPGPGVPPELRRLGRSLGLGLGGLVNVFNPEMVILGGVLRWVFPLVRDDVLEALDEWALQAAAEQAQIVLPWLGGDSVIIGAAELAFTDLLDNPIHSLQRA